MFYGALGLKYKVGVFGKTFSMTSYWCIDFITKYIGPKDEIFSTKGFLWSLS